MRRPGYVLLFCCWFPFLAIAAHAQEEAIEKKLEKGQKDLQDIRRAIATEKKKVGEKIQQEKRISSELARIRRQLGEKRREAAKLQREIDLRRSGIRQLNREIQSSEARLSKAKVLLATRLRAIYKQGETGVPSLLLSATSLHQAALNLRYLQAIAHQDRQLIRNFQREISSQREKKEEVARQLKNLSSSERALRAKQKEIAQDELQKRTLLAQIRSEKALSLHRISELQRSSQALQALIGDLQEKMKAARASPTKGAETAFLQGLHFASAKGKLPWPSQGDLIASFGRREHPRYHTFTFNKGIDIAAPMGEEIRAVFEGIVLFADWFRGYGRLAIIDHGQGFFSLYAHASELMVKAGDKVSPRQVIGKVGDSASPEGPRLHFEIRQDGKPMDPLQWLVPNP
ncbi:MAG: peptidoglycan DD-metalloendopeptidase family protein [candidate division NC10 bacterium]|nr:peptidoglycan DD-metalloendopeptidase family protein [candidate division NC10 bacterium]